MITAQIISDSPVLVAKIRTNPNSLSAKIQTNQDRLVARISPMDQTIIGRIIKPVDKELYPEPYYEVSNEYGTTIVIGE
jgi:hypothetical protein